MVLPLKAIQKVSTHLMEEPLFVLLVVLFGTMHPNHKAKPQHFRGHKDLNDCFTSIWNVHSTLNYNIVSDLPVSHNNRFAQRRTTNALTTATAESIQVMFQNIAQRIPMIAPISVRASERT